MMPFPKPDTLYPVTFPDGSVHKGNVFLSAAIKHPNWSIGDYTYASDFDPPDNSEEWAARLAPYMFPGATDRILIGKFGQFAHGIRFITDGANHAREGFSTFPLRSMIQSGSWTTPKPYVQGGISALAMTCGLAQVRAFLPGQLSETASLSGQGRSLRERFQIIQSSQAIAQPSSVCDSMQPRLQD
jgi:hypothetical protein